MLTANWQFPSENLIPRGETGGGVRGKFPSGGRLEIGPAQLEAPLTNRVCFRCRNGKPQDDVFHHDCRADDDVDVDGEFVHPDHRIESIRHMHQELRPMQEDVRRVLRGPTLRGRLRQIQGKDCPGLRGPQLHRSFPQQDRLIPPRFRRCMHFRFCDLAVDRFRNGFTCHRGRVHGLTDVRTLFISHDLKIMMDWH